jgi:hypothetical protein
LLECTSLGPSRKRGPPKGYIDAIEARLHQTEALVGILLAAAGMSYAAPSNSSSAAHPKKKTGSSNARGATEDEDAEMTDHDHGSRSRGLRRRGGRDQHKDSNRDADVDERAHGLLADLGEDALARAILARIDQSAYGPAGRAAKEGVGASAGGSGSGSVSPVGGVSVGGAGKMKGAGAGDVGGGGQRVFLLSWV